MNAKRLTMKTTDSIDVKKVNTEISYAEFDDIYSNDCNKVELVIADIENKWELRFANGRLKK